jgi:threonine/homoserine/homoserine lactone efflux protein
MKNAKDRSIAVIGGILFFVFGVAICTLAIGKIIGRAHWSGPPNFDPIIFIIIGAILIIIGLRMIFTRNMSFLKRETKDK